MRALLSIAALLSVLALLLSFWPEDRDTRSPLPVARAAPAPAATPELPLPPEIDPRAGDPEPARVELPRADPSGPGASKASSPPTPVLVLEGRVYLQVGPRVSRPADGSPFVRSGQPVPKPEFVTLPEASIRASWFDGFERGSLGGAVSDAEGRWRIEVDGRALPLSRVQIEVVAEAEGHPSQERSTSGPRSLPSTLSFDHALSNAPCGQGRVLDQRGNPVPYAGVLLQAGHPIDDSRMVLLHHATTLSDEDGVYALELPDSADPAAAYTLSAHHDKGSCSLELAASSLLQRLPDLVLLDPRPSLAGRVVAADGRALPGVRVAVSRGEASWEVWTDREGRFQLSDLAPGTYDVGVPWDASSSQSAIPPRTDLELRLAHPCAIVSLVDASGRVVRGPLQAFARHADGQSDELGTLRTNLNEAGCAVFPFEDGVSELEILYDLTSDTQLSRVVARQEGSIVVELVVAPPLAPPPSSDRP